MAKKGKSVFRKINDWLHLWVGIATGIPIVIISITGAMLVYEQEITHAGLYGSWWNVTPQESAAVLPPSQILRKAQEQYPELKIRRIWYYGLDAPVKITPDNSDSLVFVNPYTGQALAQVDHENIFEFIEDGHFNLWLPDKIGHQVVSWSTAIFFMLLVTGIILWWPKKWNKTSAKNAFTIRWGAKMKRVNYDLHNVLGFYSLLIALLIAFTGLMMGFAFFNNTVRTLTGGKPRVKTEVVPLEQRPAYEGSIHQKMDSVWNKVRKEYAVVNHEEMSIHYPKNETLPIYICTDMHNGTWRVINFDQQTLAMLSSTDKRIADAPLSEWITRSNYSMHVGSIFGQFTKVLYFLASLICASLPITGFYIWWGKKKKTKK